MTLSNVLVPAVICGILLWGLWQGVDVFACFVEGAKDGLRTCVDILPVLVALITAVGMFRASGAVDLIARLLGPLARFAGVPEEVLPLAVLRPFSSGGAMILFSDLTAVHGPDSLAGRVAAVMEGASETTFYIIAVYYGAARIHKTGYTLPAAMCADMVAVTASALFVKLWFY